MTEIAEERVVFVYPSGQRRPGRIAIGAPARVAEEPEESRCTVVLDGMQPPTSIIGVSTLHALTLALRFAKMRLSHFMADGGRILDLEDDSDLEIDAIL